MQLIIPDYIKAIAPYVPGKPIEALEREYGISDSVKLASNENPLGPSPKALAAIRQSMVSLHRYPDGAGHLLTRKIASHNGIEPENVVIGNGSDDIIALLVRALLFSCLCHHVRPRAPRAPVFWEASWSARSWPSVTSCSKRSAPTARPCGSSSMT